MQTKTTVMLLYDVNLWAHHHMRTPSLSEISLNITWIVF